MSQTPSPLATALDGRYRIERELGAGATAFVYLAHDVRHHRDVALKVLRPELAAAIGAARFLREIEITARLSHPYILPLFDSGEAAGMLYYVMPLAEGESLRHRLQASGRMSVPEAVQIAREVAEALDYAHRHDVVHRDIKPENIMLHDSHALVADFGIGKAFSAAVDQTNGLTQSGMTVGTPAYLSPEQAAGDPELDGSSDLYSLGCVLYEMLGGEPPFTGATAQAVIVKRLVQEPADLAALRPGLPPMLVQAVHRALARVPSDRFATGAEFSTALSSGEHADERGRAAAPEKSIAVLPFANMSANPENEFFADGIAEEIINALAQVRDLRVVGRTSAFSFKGRNDDLRVIGAKLNVRTVLEGSVRRAGDRVRITAQLVEVASGFHLWSAQYDRALTDIFEVQSDVAVRITHALEATLSPREHERLRRPPTTTVRSWQLYLKGRELWARRSRESADRAASLFQRALEQDDRFALAWVGLADVHLVLGLVGDTSLDAEAKAARHAIQRALEGDPELGEARATLGLIHTFYEPDPVAAEREYRRALELSPSYATAHQWYGNWLCGYGRAEEGLAELSLATELDPVSPAVSESDAVGRWHVGRIAEAERRLHETLELDPGFARARLSLAVLLAMRGDLAAAARELVGVWTAGAFGATAAEAERAASLLARGPHATLEFLADSIHHRDSPPGFVRLLEVVLLLLLQRPGDAMAALEAGRGRRWLGFVVLFAPAFDGLADRPRFCQLMDEAGTLLPRWHNVDPA